MLSLRDTLKFQKHLIFNASLQVMTIITSITIETGCVLKQNVILKSYAQNAVF